MPGNVTNGHGEAAVPPGSNERGDLAEAIETAVDEHYAK